MAIFSGIAAAVGAAFTAVSGFIATSTIGAFVLQTAAGIGLNLLAKAIAGKPEKQGFSVQGKMQSGGDLPRSFVVGLGATAGSLVYVNTWGERDKTPNTYLTQVIALSDLPVGGLAELWVNGEKATINWNDTSDVQGFPVDEYRTGTDHNHLWIKFYDGTQTEADSFLINRVSGNDRPWGSNRVGRGVAYAIVTSKIEEELFSGFPQFKFVLSGLKLYDPSRDSTRGGSGSHRLGDPATWGGDGDHLPVVQIYNLLLGLTYNGSWFYGVQNMAAARLPVAAWIGQINKCRAQIAGPNGYEPTYRTGGEIQVSSQLGDAIDALLTGAQGRLAEIGGTYKVHVGAPDAPVASLDDGLILSTEGQSFSPFFGLADTINGIAATYPSPAEGWVPKAAPPIYRTDLEARDGNRRLMADVALDFVPYPSQAQRLMKSALEEGQRARRHTLVLPPEFGALEPGVDVISWTSARNGYVGKLFRVDGVADKANLDVVVDLTEVDPADYDWNHGTDYRVPVDGPVGPIRPAPQIIVDWYAEGAAIYDNDGIARRPAIRLSWDGDQPDVAAVVFEVRLRNSGEVIYRGRTDAPEVGAILISQGLLPLTSYDVHGRYEPRSDRPTLWSGWLPVTTPDVRFTELDIYLPGMVEEITQQIGEINEFATNGAREALERFREMALDEGNQASYDFIGRQLLREEVDDLVGPGGTVIQRLDQIEVEYQGGIAAISEALTLAVGPEGSLVQQIEGVRAEFEGGLASTNQALLAYVGPDGSVVQRLDAIEVEFDGALASVTNELVAKVGPNGSVIQRMNAMETEYEGGLAAANTSLLSYVGPNGSITGRLNTMTTKYDNGLSSVEDLVESEVSRVDGRITAQAGTISSLNSEVDGVAASITVRAQTTASGQAGVSRYVIQAKTGSATTSFVSSSFFLDVSNGVGSAGVIADSFFVANPASPGQKFAPFVFQNGVLRANAAVLGSLIVGEVDAGLLKARSIIADKFVLNGVTVDIMGFGAHSAIAYAGVDTSYDTTGSAWSEVHSSRIWLSMNSPGKIIGWWAGSEEVTTSNSDASPLRLGTRVAVNGGAPAADVQPGDHYIDLFTRTRGTGTGRFFGTLMAVGSKKT